MRKKNKVAGIVLCSISIITMLFMLYGKYSVNHILNGGRFKSEIQFKIWRLAYNFYTTGILSWVVGFIAIVILILGILLIKKVESNQIDFKNNKKRMIEFTSNTSGEVKTSPVGFSWTTLFFGFFPALFRGDWKWAVIQFLLGGITLGISWIVFAFMYNKLYIKDLFNNGFTPVKDEDTEYLIKVGIITSSQMKIKSNIINSQIEKNSTQTIGQQLKEFKELLDSEIITQEEFDKKKAELLS